MLELVRIGCVPPALFTAMMGYWCRYMRVTRQEDDSGDGTGDGSGQARKSLGFPADEADDVDSEDEDDEAADATAELDASIYDHASDEDGTSGAMGGMSPWERFGREENHQHQRQQEAAEAIATGARGEGKEFGC